MIHCALRACFHAREQRIRSLQLIRAYCEDGKLLGGRSQFSTKHTNTHHAAASVTPGSSANHGNERDKEEPVGDSRTRTSRKGSLTKAYLDLAKAKLSSLVVATTAAGFVAAGGPIATKLGVFGCAVAGTALCSSSAAALNQIWERAQDSKMKRTQLRPLVTGALTVNQATTAATLWGISGVSLLAIGTDPVTTALGASNIVLYAGWYTYMKPRSIYNTWVGAVVGAVPPVMGWTAATGGSILDIEALLLGSTLYLWQMPHFFALSYMHRVDYQRGGFAMVPCLEKDGKQTSNLIARYSLYLSTIPFLATLTDVTSSMFMFEGIALNACQLTLAYRFKQDRTNSNARRIFLFSLLYLPSLLILFLIHSKVWDEEKCRGDAFTKFLSEHIHYIRERGRELCVHEKAANLAIQGKDACPVTVGSKHSSRRLNETSTALEETVSSVKSGLDASSRTSTNTEEP